MFEANQRLVVLINSPLHLLVCALCRKFNQVEGLAMASSNDGISRPTSSSSYLVPEKTESTPLCVRSIEEYAKKSKDEARTFVKNNKIDIEERISEEEYDSARSLGAGVSGSKVLMIGGEERVLKRPIITDVFARNYAAVANKGELVSHKLVSESDDSFADFPRKEVLGYQIGQRIGLNIPKTQLALVGDDVASTQKFIPKDEAVTMAHLSEIYPYEIDLESAFKTFFFHLLTENIDGHSGNILLKYILRSGEDADADELMAKYEAIPIDFGLIFPNHDTIYPKELNYVKKNFYYLFEGKSISIKQHLVPFIKQACMLLKDPEILRLARPHELEKLQVNIQAFERIANSSEKSLKVHEFLNVFVGNVVGIRGAKEQSSGQG